jgi:hypothetical protein
MAQFRALLLLRCLGSYAHSVLTCSQLVCNQIVLRCDLANPSSQWLCQRSPAGKQMLQLSCHVCSPAPFTAVGLLVQPCECCLCCTVFAICVSCNPFHCSLGLKCQCNEGACIEPVAGTSTWQPLTNVPAKAFFTGYWLATFPFRCCTATPCILVFKVWRCTLWSISAGAQPC